MGTDHWDTIRIPREADGFAVDHRVVDDVEPRAVYSKALPSLRGVGLAGRVIFGHLRVGWPANLEVQA